MKKYLTEVPYMIVASFILFSVYPTWQAAIVSIGSFCFLSFKAWLTETRTDELKKIRDEIVLVKQQIEGLQLGRTMGR